MKKENGNRTKKNVHLPKSATEVFQMSVEHVYFDEPYISLPNKIIQSETSTQKVQENFVGLETAELFLYLQHICLNPPLQLWRVEGC